MIKDFHYECIVYACNNTPAFTYHWVTNSGKTRSFKVCDKHVVEYVRPITKIAGNGKLLITKIRWDKKGVNSNNSHLIGRNTATLNSSNRKRK